MLKSQNILATKVKCGKSDKCDDFLDEQADKLICRNMENACFQIFNTQINEIRSPNYYSKYTE